jgi:Hint module
MIIRIDELKVGDRVRTGPGEYSEVFMFTHKLMNSRSKFTRIAVASGISLALSPGHYLHVNGYLNTAGSTKVGDFVTLACGTQSKVLHTEEVSMTGLFNPQTLDGNIVVDGVFVSTYTQAVHPAVAHALLSPIRFLYKHGWSPLRNSFHSTNYRLDLLSPRGASVY